jgi:uncharacterized protein (DUF39 family)
MADSLNVESKEKGRWKIDREKCRESNAAEIQRKMLMEMVLRHEMPDSLNYTCGQSWVCEPMPRKIAPSPSTQPEISKPKQGFFFCIQN